MTTENPHVPSQIESLSLSPSKNIVGLKMHTYISAVLFLCGVLPGVGLCINLLTYATCCLWKGEYHWDVATWRMDRTDDGQKAQKRLPVL